MVAMIARKIYTTTNACWWFFLFPKPQGASNPAGLCVHKERNSICPLHKGQISIGYNKTGKVTEPRMGTGLRKYRNRKNRNVITFRKLLTALKMRVIIFVRSKLLCFKANKMFRICPNSIGIFNENKKLWLDVKSVVVTSFFVQKYCGRIAEKSYKMGVPSVAELGYGTKLRNRVTVPQKEKLRKYLGTKLCPKALQGGCLSIM